MPRLRIDPGWLAAAVLPLIAVLPTFNGTHIIDTADGPFHVHRIVAASILMQNGDFYPRWIPWFHLGYGYPVLNYYAPAGTLLGGLLGLIGIPAPMAFALLTALAWMIGSVGVYALGRRYLGAAAGLAGAVLWSYAPGWLETVWNQGSLPQIIAMGVLPFLLLALGRAYDQPGRRGAVYLALASAALVLAHQPTTLIAALFLVPAVIIMLIWTALNNRAAFLPRLLCLSGGVALGAGLAAVFWLPMLLELPYIQVSQPAADIPAFIRSSLLRLDQLFIQPLPPDQSDFSRRLPDTLGLLGGVLALAGSIALLRLRRWRLALLLVAGGLLTVFLALDISEPVWLSLSLLAQLRFPARVLRVGFLFFALLGGASILLLPRRWQSWGAVAIGVTAVVAALPTIYPNRDWLDYSDVSPNDEVRYEAQTFAFGGTSYNEFRPRYGARAPLFVPSIEDYDRYPLRIFVVDPQQPGITVEQTGDLTVRTQSAEPFELRFRQLYFPGWSAAADGQPLAVTYEPDYGLIAMQVPAGEHTVQLWREATPAHWVGTLLTLFSLGAAVVIWRRGRPVEHVEETLTGRTAARIALVVTGVALVNTLFILPHTDWFRLRSPLDAPAYMHTPVHQTFGDAYELLGYTLKSAEVPAGGQLDLTLYWRALRPLETIYRPVVQVVNRRDSEAWGVREPQYLGPRKVAHQPDYFISDDLRIPIFDTSPAYVGYITVKLVDPQGNLLLTPDGGDRILLPDPVRIHAPNPDVPRVMDDRFAESIELWCASVERRTADTLVTLYWHTLAPLDSADLRVFVHGFDGSEFIASGDAPIFGGDYLPPDWLPGQTLIDRYALPGAPPEIAVGLYLPDGARLPLVHNGQPIPDGGVRLSDESPACTP